MEEHTNKIITEVNHILRNITLGENDIFTKATQAVEILEKTFSNLKIYISAYEFKNEAEEIKFFKDIKPLLFSKLIYYRKIYNIEIMRPNGSLDTQKNYLNSELDRIKVFFDRNQDIYKYYRTGCSHFDRYYFLRGKPDIQLNLDSFYFERDPIFSTNFDFKIAKILANEMLSIYLNEELRKLENQIFNSTNDNQFSNFPLIKISWTAKKAELVEQIYAWDSAGCFNYGNTNIKELAEYIEIVFNIDLGDYYHTFLEMRERKGNRTLFLDKLIRCIEERMDRLDRK